MGRRALLPFEVASHPGGSAYGTTVGGGGQSAARFSRTPGPRRRPLPSGARRAKAGVPDDLAYGHTALVDRIGVESRKEIDTRERRQLDGGFVGLPAHRLLKGREGGIVEPRARALEHPGRRIRGRSSQRGLRNTERVHTSTGPVRTGRLLPALSSARSMPISNAACWPAGSARVPRASGLPGSAHEERSSNGRFAPLHRMSSRVTSRKAFGGESVQRVLS